LNHIRNVTGLLFHTLVFIACDVNYRLKLSYKMVNAVFTVQQAKIGKGAYCFISVDIFLCEVLCFYQNITDVIEIKCVCVVYL